MLGAPHGLATAAQGLAALIAVAISLAGLPRRPSRSGWRSCCCAMLLASPHVSNYDLILLAMAALLAVRALPESSRPLALILPLAAWLAPLYNPPRVMPLGLVTPLCFWA